MSKKITAENGASFEVGQLGITVVHPEGIATIYARLTDAQRVELAAALDPGRRGLHVRLDNQAKTLATFQRERDEWKARAEAAEAPTAPAVTRKLVYDAVGAVYDVNGHRGPWPGVEPITDAVCHLFGIETDPDPVETLAMQIEAATRKAVRQACESLSSVTTGLGPEVIEEMLDITEASRRLARHVLGQKASDE